MQRVVSANATALEGHNAPPVWCDVVVFISLLGVVASMLIHARVGERCTIPLGCVPLVCFNVAVCTATITVYEALTRAVRAGCARIKRLRASAQQRRAVSMVTRVWGEGHGEDACVRIEFYDGRGAVRAVVLDSLTHMAGEDCVRADEMYSY